VFDTSEAPSSAREMAFVPQLTSGPEVLRVSRELQRKTDTDDPRDRDDFDYIK